MNKRTKNLSLILLLFFFNYSCNYVALKRQMQEHYNKSLGAFPPNIVSHFPKKVSINSQFETDVPSSYRLSDYCFAHNYLMFEKSYDASTYSKQKSHFDSLTLKMYYPNSKSHILIFSYCDVMKIG